MKKTKYLLSKNKNYFYLSENITSMTNNHFLQIISFLLLFAVVGCKTSAKLADNVELKSGDVFTYRIHKDTDLEMDMVGQTQIATNKQTIDLKYSIYKINPDGSIEAILTYKRLKLWQINGFETINFDSEKMADRENLPIRQRIFQKMIGQQLRLKLDKSGAIQYLTGASEYIDDFFSQKEASNEMSLDLQLLGFYRAIREQLGDDAMKELLTQLHTIKPPTKFEPGLTWMTEMSTQTGIDVKKKSEFTCSKITSRGIELKLSSVVEPNPDTNGTTIGISKVKFALKGAEKGDYLVNGAGWTTNADIKTNLVGNATIVAKNLAPIQSNVIVKIETKFERLN